MNAQPSFSDWLMRANKIPFVIQIWQLRILDWLIQFSHYSVVCLFKHKYCMRDDGEQRYSGSSIVLNMASLVKKSSIVEVESLDQLLGKRLDDDGSGEQEKTRDEIKYLLSRTLREPGFDEASRFPHALECPIREISGQYGMSKSRHLETTSCVVSYQGRLLRISRPAISYTKLIRLALSKCKRGCMVLGEIYDFITGHFPYYRYAGAGWKV